MTRKSSKFGEQSSTDPFHRILVGGVPFACTNPSEASAWFLNRAQTGASEAISVRLSNAYCLALTSENPEYARLLSEKGLNLPDGYPVAKLMKWKTVARGLRPERVRGPSFFVDVLAKSQTTNTRHFFLGSAPSTLQKLRNEVSTRFPGVIVAGSYSPPFAEVDEAYLANIEKHVLVESPDVIWVGLGTPKQDFVAQALTDRLGITTAGVGAAFDFVAGTVSEAPVWVQKSGFEWFYRFIAEPRRLWKRYLFGNAKFLRVALFQRSR
ncbi:WecB/TagA/CpsF family glycosyltransferase [Agreia sp. Leaf283]|uniref:WecB/TagA/CpsF family glycosyltransferase n=1 Tax=Agreia sp. Leaf283 TaxID=1736321 RepID=UPI0009EA7EDF|nr:WecB/TagA/CpsF family glycosyltransferase [Agreia sp. Leaf283]